MYTPAICSQSCLTAPKIGKDILATGGPIRARGILGPTGKMQLIVQITSNLRSLVHFRINLSCCNIK